MIDNVSGVERFTFDIPELYQGLEFLTVAVGTFAVGEVFKTILQREGNDGEIAKINRILPTKQDMKDSAAPIARGSVLGFFIGFLPGAGAILASFFAYISRRKKLAKIQRSSVRVPLKGSLPRKLRITLHQAGR